MPSLFSIFVPIKSISATSEPIIDNCCEIEKFGQYETLIKNINVKNKEIIKNVSDKNTS